MTLTPRLRVVQPRPPMAKLDAPYMLVQSNKDGSARYYFAPKQLDRRAGWATVRLHDEYERPIADPLKAAEACRAIAAIYTAWRQGAADAGPWRIDRLGRVVDDKKKRRAPQRHYKPGQIGAMVADYLVHELFLAKDAKTQKEYRIYLGLFVEKFGDTYWRRLAPGVVRKWLLARGRAGGWSGMHSCYRTMRAFFGKVRLCYDSVDHPGFVPPEANPVVKLDLGLPTVNLLLWPREAIDAFVAMADQVGEPSIGDAVVMMAWLGVRKQDWLSWPANVFDQELLAFRQDKTERPLVLPWKKVPALAARVASAVRRRGTVTAATFFHDRDGRPWRSPGTFRKAFNRLRDQLSAKHPAFATNYYVGIDPANPLQLPTDKLTMRTMRHTCITLNHDAGVPRELIPSITGHELATIDEVMKCYNARTADQAAAALTIRLAHEAKEAEG